MQNKINDELSAIIHAQPRGSVISTFLESWDTCRISVSLFMPALTMNSITDICKLMGWMNHAGVASPLWVYTQGDSTDHRICRIWIEEGDPRIGIPEYWLWSQYAAHRKAYAVYINRLAHILGLPILRRGYSAEREFASVFPPMGQRQKGNTVLSLGELKREFSVFDWDAFLTAAGYAKERQRDVSFRVTSRPFMHHLQSRLLNWSMDRWRGWFVCILAQWAAGNMPAGPLRSAWFAYNRAFLQGMKADMSPPRLRNAIVPLLMPNYLGKLWVERFCSKETRRKVEGMCERIRHAAATAIADTPWMAASTRSAALRKLKQLTIEVGWPDEKAWTTHETVCRLSPTDYFGNLIELSKAASDMNTSLKGNCRHPLGGNWSRPVFEVNAYYYPDENRFLLPAAILRPPFWDPQASVSTNYGSIGSTIGHEISHAFDSEGRNYDDHGDRRDWWTDHDDRENRRKAGEIVRLFESRQYRGMSVNGEQTLVENIADIVGIQFALAGMADELKRTPTLAEYREFFDAYAVSWRAKDRRRRAAQLLVTDFHAPPELRVNHVVRLFEEWYAAYGVGPDCKEWIPPARRTRFFGA
jgi:predicted metalloendopeptidase